MEQDLFKTLPHLQLRHKKYGVRVPVPTEIQAVVGKKEITRSLGTGDPDKVPSEYRKKMVEIDDIIEEARRTLNPPEPPSISANVATELAFNYFEELIAEEEKEARQLIGDEELEDKAKDLRIAELLSDINVDLDMMVMHGEDEAIGIADEILRNSGHPTILVKRERAAGRFRWERQAHVNTASDGYKQLLKICYLGQIETWQRIKAIYTGKTFPKSESNFDFGKIGRVFQNNDSVQPVNIADGNVSIYVSA